MQASAADRFAYLARNMALNNAMNGVIRTRMLRRVHAMGSFRSADVVMMAELALLGKFAQVPEPLFFRRMSAEGSTARRGPVEVDRHFEPDATSALRWQHWKFQWCLLRAALAREPFSPQKARAVNYALHSIVWARSRLMSDLVAAVRAGRHRQRCVPGR